MTSSFADTRQRVICASVLSLQHDVIRRLRVNMTSDQSFVRRTSKNVVAGTVAGIAVCLVGHPFDTLKVRLQTQPINNPIYSGLADCVYKTLKWEGIGGLYAGVGKYLGIKIREQELISRLDSQTLRAVTVTYGQTSSCYMKAYMLVLIIRYD